MNQQEYEDALDYLDGTSGRLSLSNEEEDDLEEFITMTSMLANVYDDDRDETELTSQEIDTLEEIAENGIGIARDKACSLLSFFYEFDCEEEEELINFQHLPIDASIDNKGKVIVSPNPVNDALTIDLSSVSLINGRLELYHSDGRLLLSEEIPSLTFKLKLNLTTYPDGIYILRITDSGGDIFTDKILKQD
jgi:hypothetical protein